MRKTRERFLIWAAFAAAFGLIMAAEPRISPASALQENGQNETWRKQAPVPGPARAFSLPAVHVTRLANGLIVALIEDHRAPIVTINAGLPIGAITDPSDSPGLAEATADLLTEGARGFSSKELSSKVESLGGRLTSSAGPDYSSVSGAVLAENAEQMIAVVADVLLHPSFPEEEVSLYKKNRIQALAVQRQDPQFVVTEEFNRIIYGPHPYSIAAPTPQSVSALTRDQIEHFYSANYGPAGAAIVIVGDFQWASLEPGVASLFSAWRAPASAERKLPSPPASVRRVYLVDRPGSEQADIRIGNLAINRSDKDLIPLLVANTILGGGTSSRLFLDIREKRGYTYDVSSSVSALGQYGAFFGATETRMEVVVPAINAMLEEFDRLRNEPVSAVDLAHAKNYLNGTFSLSLSTEGGLADRVLGIYLFGLGQDYLETFRSKVDAVTAEQVQRAAREHILTGPAIIVVVGDAGKLRDALKPLGPVTIVGVEGSEKPAG
ncbi:MAG TPA: pitrilysin family protein [Blastocatellia bacterium]|nr:pitrilysin family protein [Blastocatellia bacterium]